MRASLLSLALGAVLATAAPASNTDSKDASLGIIEKRGLVILNTPLFNGVPTTPGTQIRPGWWIASDTVHICHMSCLDPAKPKSDQDECLADKCLSAACKATSCVNAIIKSNVYVIGDVSGYWGNELKACPAPAAPRTVCYLPAGTTVPTVLSTVSA